MLVDAGRYQTSSDIILDWLQAQAINDLTYTVATHYHADHIEGFLDLFVFSHLPDIAYDRGDNPNYHTAVYDSYIIAASA